MKKIISSITMLSIALASAIDINNILVDTTVKTSFDITLDENKTAGYSCKLAKYDPSVIDLTGVTSMKKSDAIGSPNQKTWAFQIIENTLPQTTGVTISCARPWETKEPPKKHSYRIIIK